MKLAFVDTETGGLDPLRNPLLSIGAVCEGSEFEASIDPDPNLVITPDAARVNGWPWRDRELHEEKEVVPAFIGWVRSTGAKFLVAHNAPFDYGFLRAAASRYHLADALPRFICTMSIAVELKLTGNLNISGFSLNALANAYGVNANRDIHNALEDARIVEAIWNAMHKIAQPANQQTGTRRPSQLGWGFSSRR